MDWIALIPALPALAFLVMLPLSRRIRNKMLWLPVSAMSGSLLLSILAFTKVWPGEIAEEGAKHAEALWHLSWSFARLGGETLHMGLALDAFASVTLLVVTIVGLGVQVYSLGYMHKDERVGWYYAVLSLFTAAMLGLVLSESLILTFAMWEMMGLCSYLLIGFWYELEGPRKASQKAFLTTRVGDLGFLIALFVIFTNAGTFDLWPALESISEWAPGAATIAAVGLLWAAMGKSAQAPLHVWLPDAMAGPTPASALIHAATMVAAGVFVVARTMPIFEAAPTVMAVMLFIGATTALLGGLLACVQHDVKKVLAYSTISQLGFMFIALGAGSATAAMFHLTTHAFFKSLMFLGAGVIIHAAHTQDMRDMGGLAKHLPVTTTTFTIGALALAGVPPLAGFFSKDEILAVLLHDHHYFAFGAAILASVITAFYMTRLWFRVFSGPKQADELHEGHRTMLAPMIVLAAITVVAGFGSVAYARLLGHEGHWPSAGLIVLSFALAGIGIGIGYWVYGRRSVVINTRVWKQRWGYLFDALQLKFYFDLTYDRILVRGLFVVSDWLWSFDARAVDGVVNGAGAAFVRSASAAWTFDRVVVDGAVNGLGWFSKRTGTLLRRIQTGRIQDYQRLVIGAVVVLMVFLVLKGA